MGTDAYGYDDGWSNEPLEADDDPLDRALFRTKPSRVPSYNDEHPLLFPLSQAQDALTRLDALTSAASPSVAEGVRARLAFREASGWLSYSHVWVHHNDLALRASGKTGSYSAAALRGDVRGVIPNSLADGGIDLESIPDDIYVEIALKFARYWRRLVELRTWSPIQDEGILSGVLDNLAGMKNRPGEDDMTDWLYETRKRADSPALLRALKAGRDWMNLPGISPDLPIDGIFLTAAVWKEKSNANAIPLPFWSAPTTHHLKMSMKTGVEWTAGALDCIARSARIGLDELERLQAAEAKIAEIGRTKRSMLPSAITYAIRMPIFTAKGLADDLKISAQAGAVLVRQMLEMDFLLEATRRDSWRAFIMK
jgi:hypothetical protein